MPLRDLFVQEMLANYFSWEADRPSHASPDDVDALRALADYVIALPSDDPLIMLAATIVPTAFAALQFGPPTTDMPTQLEPESVNRMEWSVQSPRETLIVFLAAVATDLDRATTAARDEANRERRLRRHAQRQGLRIAKRQSAGINLCPHCLVRGPREWEFRAGHHCPRLR